MSRTLVVMPVILCAGVGLSACDGDSGSSSDDASVEGVERANAICDEWRASPDARGAFPVEDFDPEDPSARELPAVGEYVAAANAAQEAALASLRDLVAPEEIQGQLDDLVAAVEGRLASSRRQAQAARDADVAAFTATLAEVGPSTQAVEDAGDALGASGCGF